MTWNFFSKAVERTRALNMSNVILFFDVLIILALVSLISVFLVYPEGDVMEHIHASYMVFSGKVPYRDFFEHHNPLLWYMMGWFVQLFERNSSVIGIVDYITFLFSAVGICFLYKIVVEFLGNKTAGLLSVIFVLLPCVNLYYVYFKPDNYMMACLMVGIYYFFSYIRDLKVRDLIVSYLFFTISFLFLQKALLHFPVIGMVTLYLLYKKQMRVKDFFVAMCLPVAIILVFVGWLYCFDLLDIYYKTSFLFNHEMYKYIGNKAVSKPWELAKVVFGLAVILGVCLFKVEGKYFRIWFFITVFNLLLKLFYFSVHVYYFYEAYYYAVVLAAVGIMKLAEQNKLLRVIVVLQTQVYVALMCYYLVFDLKVTMKRPDDFMFDYTASNSNKCDYIFASSSNLNLFQKDLGYYWFLFGQLDVVGEKIGIHPKEDYNKLIEEKLPKFIYLFDVYDRFEKVRGNKILVHDFDFEMINKYYNKKSNDYELTYDKEKGLYEKKVEDGFFELKGEYRKSNCEYNDKTGEWEYK